MAKGKKSKSNDSSMVIYRGPIARQSQQPQAYRVAMKQFNLVSSASAGYLELYFTTQMVPSMPEWSNIAPLWREYRVLGMKFEYFPSYDMGSGSRTFVPGAIVSYHGGPPAWQGAVTSSSTQNTWLMEGAKSFHPGKYATVEWRMADVEEAQFFSTSASLSVGGFYAITGGTIQSNVNYGAQCMTVLVEFKGRV